MTTDQKQQAQDNTSAAQKLLTVWPLMFGIALLMVSSGLQSTLLGLRAEHENFSHIITGLVMSMYYCGFLIGCVTVPKMVASVGHIRVFAALASVASTTVLFHGMFVTPVAWMATRLLTGICFSGIFIIAESWLNKISNNAQRGKIFAAYIFFVHGGLFAGQFLINLAPISEMDLFVIVSVLISLALTPITLTNTKTPPADKVDKVGFYSIFKKSPLAMAGVFFAGLSSSSVFSLGPVYAHMSEMDTHTVAIFMATYILGNALLPLFFGSLSDRIDRRKTIILIGITAIISSISMTLFPSFFFMAFFVGGANSSLYSVAITHMQDRISRDDIVASTRSLILFNSVGSMFGPIISGYMLTAHGVDVFFAQVTVYMTIIILIACYRMVKGAKIRADRKKKFMYTPSVSTPTFSRIHMQKINADKDNTDQQNPPSI